MSRPQTRIALCVAAALAACSPTLDWREFVVEGTDLAVTFPCRPDRHARTVSVAARTLQMEMLVCAAGDATYALSFADVADPARVASTLAALRGVAIDNVRGREPKLGPVAIKGMTPNEEAGRVSVAGQLPDGAAVRADAAFFSRGLRVYQATVIGAKPSPVAIETFLGGLRFTP